MKNYFSHKAGRNMKTPCQDCIYGAKGKGFWGTEYNFTQAIKAPGEVVHYKDGEYGCRSHNFDSKEKVCLNNAFSEHRSSY